MTMLAMVDATGSKAFGTLNSLEAHNQHSASMEKLGRLVGFRTPSPQGGPGSIPGGCTMLLERGAKTTGKLGMVCPPGIQNLSC